MAGLFLAVMGCRRDRKNGCHDWFRKQISGDAIPYKIFLGSGLETSTDEISLSTDDSYQRLPWKLQAALRWIFEQPESYTYILKVDCDSLVWPARMTDFSGYDYVGNFADGKLPILRADTYAFGGGYILSREAAQKVIFSRVEDFVEPRNYPPFDKTYAEDEFVGRVLRYSRRLHSEQFQSHFAGRMYNGSTQDLIVLGNSWSTDRGRR